MATTLELGRMTVAEKLAAMEALWVDLTRNPQDVPVPQWHKDLLDEREKAVQEGKAVFLEWGTAKKQIADEIRKNRVP